MNTYRIYSKHKNQNRFKPVDWAEGIQVTNLIYGTIIPSDFLNKAKQVLTDSIKLNDGLILQLRCIETNKVIFEIKSSDYE